MQGQSGRFVWLSYCDGGILGIFDKRLNGENRLILGGATMDKLLRQWITQIIQQNEQLIRIAVRQRAKFEG